MAKRKVPEIAAGDLTPEDMDQSAQDALGFPEPNVTGDEINVQGVAPTNIPVPATFDIAPPVDPNGLPSFLVDEAKSPAQKLTDLVNSPEYQKKLQDLSDKGNQAIREQQEGLDENKKSIGNFEKQSGGINFSPAIALVDSWTGSDLGKGYKPPMSQEEKAQKLMVLKNQLQTQRQGITKEQLDLLKQQLAGYMNPIKTQAMLDRLGQGDRRNGLREDQITAQAVNAIDNHPLVKQSTQQLNQIDVDRHTLMTAKTVNAQMVHEISNGIANALNGGRAAGLGMAQMQDLSTMQATAANFEQYVTDHPKQALSPAMRKQMVDTLDRLQESYKKIRSQMVDSLVRGRSYNNNPQAQAALREVQAKYAYTPPEPVQKPAARHSPQKQKTSGPPVDADLDHMSNEELQQWMKTHGG